MEVKVKKLDPNAVIPTKANINDAGLDLTSTSLRLSTYEEGDYIEYGTGLSVEIPEGHVGLLFPRSSISKMALSLCNSVGVIDAGYRGEIRLRFNPLKEEGRAEPIYKVGDRIGQLIIMPIPTVTLKEVDELDDTDRGEGGFGSSGT